MAGAVVNQATGQLHPNFTREALQQKAQAALEFQAARAERDRLLADAQYWNGWYSFANVGCGVAESGLKRAQGAVRVAGAVASVAVVGAGVATAAPLAAVAAVGVTALWAADQVWTGLSEVVTGKSEGSIGGKLVRKLGFGNQFVGAALEMAYDIGPALYQIGKAVPRLWSKLRGTRGPRTSAGRPPGEPSAPPAEVHALTNRNGIFEVLSKQPISGTTRGAHRAAANRGLLQQLEGDPHLNSRFGEMLGVEDVLGQMRKGRGALRNPPGTEWHHPVDDPYVMLLLRRQVHRDPALQDLLHPGNIGGFGTHYGAEP
jgi:hypothetical protein